jgi:hypothetical protein
MSLSLNTFTLLFAAQISLILGLLLLRAKKVRVHGEKDSQSR